MESGYVVQDDFKHVNSSAPLAPVFQCQDSKCAQTMQPTLFPSNKHSANGLKSNGTAGAFRTTCGPMRCYQQPEEDRGKVNRKRQTESITLASTEPLSPGESISTCLSGSLHDMGACLHEDSIQHCSALWIHLPSLPPPLPELHTRGGPMSQQRTCVLTVSCVSGSGCKGLSGTTADSFPRRLIY